MNDGANHRNRRRSLLALCFGLSRPVGRLAYAICGRFADGAEVRPDALIVYAAHPIALAEHFHYRHVARALPRYRQDVAAAVTGPTKVCVRREGVVMHDLERDPEESNPQPASLDDFGTSCRREGLDEAAIGRAVSHLGSWRCESVV